MSELHCECRRKLPSPEIRVVLQPDMARSQTRPARPDFGKSDHSRQQGDAGGGQSSCDQDGLVHRAPQGESKLSPLNG